MGVFFLYGDFIFIVTWPFLCILEKSSITKKFDRKVAKCKQYKRIPWNKEHVNCFLTIDCNVNLLLVHKINQKTLLKPSSPETRRMTIAQQQQKRKILSLRQLLKGKPYCLHSTKQFYTTPQAQIQQKCIFTHCLKNANNLFNHFKEGSRARNNGRSTDNVRTDWGVDQSTFRLAGHVDWSQSIVLKMKSVVSIVISM